MRVAPVHAEMKRALCLAVAVLLVLMVLPSLAVPEKTPPAPGVTLYFFWGEGCSHCARAKPFLAELQRRHPGLRIESWEVLEHRENLPLLMEMAKARNKVATGVPTFIVGDRVLSGFSEGTGAEIERLVASLEAASTPGTPEAQPPPSDTGTLSLPLLGRVDSSSFSLPVFTIIIAGLDSFNPCAFFVLFFLLSLLVHAHSRPRMLLIGGVFVLCSGLFYFLFMAAWLNLFLITGALPAVTLGAGIIALAVAAINIKDYFWFGKGISLTIPQEQKPKLFDRMRNLLKATSPLSMLTGTVVLALAANSYEILCTAGFPMVYTRMLTLQQLSAPKYYLYLAFYNCVYIIPLAAIVGTFTVTLGSRKLTERQGRVLKLLSGLMMLGLGLLLLIDPSLLNSPLASAGLLVGTLAVASLILLATRPVKR